MTKTLTEQWREGKLPEGLYYIEGKGNHDIALIRNRYCPVLTSPYCEGNVFESEFVPVATVPSYDAYRGLVSKTEQLEKKLEIATKALEEYADRTNWVEGNFMCVYDGKCFADEESAEQAIKEMEGVK